jgi:hypothetical protein
VSTTKAPLTEIDELICSNPFFSNQWCLWQLHSVFPGFVRTVLARDFTDLVRLLQFTQPSPQLFFRPDSFLNVCCFITTNSSFTFNGWSLPIPRSLPDCPGPDAMGWDRHRRLSPLIDAIRYQPQRTRISPVCIGGRQLWRRNAPITEGAPGMCDSVTQWSPFWSENEWPALVIHRRTDNSFWHGPKLSLWPKEARCCELSARSRLEANTLTAPRRLNFWRGFPRTVRWFTAWISTFWDSWVIPSVQFNGHFGMFIV